MMLRGVCLILVLITITNGLPVAQQRSSESPVIFIDFNYEGKQGEKSLRSLDQVSYQDGVNRGRSRLKDSYGNPIQYDTLEAIDAKKPSNNKNDPNQFIIPGYASGILQPHEVPTRSNFNGETPRKIDDDRIHFVDPLQNAYSGSDKPVPTPSTSLSAPVGTPDAVGTNQTPIIIPKPNLDLPETPQTPIDDPLNHELHPPSDGSTAAPESTPETPSFALETPKGNEQNSQKVPLTQDLIPPQIPTEGQSVLIPRPNIDVSETPIDDDTNALLNQGLLPPSDTPAGFGPDKPELPDSLAPKRTDNSSPTFSNPNQDGPVVITEVLFAPKPSNGLLPPKDPLPNEINSDETTATPNKFTGSFGGQPGGSKIPQKEVQPTVATPNKFTGTFGGSPGVLGQPTQIPVQVSTPNKFSGSFGGSPGVLGQPGVNNVAPQTQIPVQVSTPNKFGGSFGGSPGVLGQPTQIPVQVSTPNKFSGSFGGSQGVLGGTGPAINQIPVVIVQDPFAFNKPSQGPTPTQSVFTQPKPSTVNKYQGGFGGSPGVLVSNNQFDRITPTQQQQTSSLPSVAPTFATSVVNKFGADDSSSTNLNQAPTTQTLSQLPSFNNDFPSSPKENVIQKYTGQFGGAPGILSPYDNSKN